MPLQFNPYDELRRRNEAPPMDFNQTVTNPIMQGLQMMIQNRELERQREAQNIDLAMKGKTFDEEHGQGSFDALRSNVSPRPKSLLRPVPTAGSIPEGPIDPSIDPTGYASRYGTRRLKMFQETSDRDLTRRKTEAEIKYNEARARNLGQNGGKPPPGYRWNQNGDLEMIPGGPADAKARDAEDKAARVRSSNVDQANVALTKIDQALSKIGPMNTGAMAATKGIPFVGQMTGAVDVDADLTTIKALLGFDQLGKMKEQSRAGASGLGALSENEMRLLISARANLEQAQTEAQLRQRLTELKTHYSNWLEMESGINPYERGQGGGSKGSPSPQNGGERIRVRNRQTGKTGSISPQFFDPAKYERVP